MVNSFLFQHCARGHPQHLHLHLHSFIIHTTFIELYFIWNRHQEEQGCPACILTLGYILSFSFMQTFNTVSLNTLNLFLQPVLFKSTSCQAERQEYLSVRNENTFVIFMSFQKKIKN